MTRSRSRYLSLGAFVLLTVGGGLVIGALTRPGAWYAELAKPPFTPPNWLFGPVWTALYIVIAVAGWRTWQRAPSGRAMLLWWTQLALNFAWSPVFFGMQQTGVALIVIALLLASVLGFMAAAWRTDRIAAWLFAPYAAWVAFASVLNAAIHVMNPA